MTKLQIRTSKRVCDNHPMLDSPPLALLCHPASACPLQLQLHVRLTRQPDAWQLHYVLQGDISQLHLPPPAAQPGPADGLWQHSCFEAFVGQPAPTGWPAYHEFNFSPAGHWAAYRFAKLRQPDKVHNLALPAPRIHCQHQTDRFTLCALLADQALPAHPTTHPLALGLSAVLETKDGHLSYWALHHPAPRPDFHHRAGWTATLSAP